MNSLIVLLSSLSKTLAYCSFFYRWKKGKAKGQLYALLLSISSPAGRPWGREGRGGNVEPSHAAVKFGRSQARWPDLAFTHFGVSSRYRSVWSLAFEDSSLRCLPEQTGPRRWQQAGPLTSLQKCKGTWDTEECLLTPLFITPLPNELLPSSPLSGAVGFHSEAV